MSETNTRPVGFAYPLAFDTDAVTAAEDARAAGFTHVCLVWEPGDRSALAKDAAAMRAAGLTVVSAHGPLYPLPGMPGGVNHLWQAGDAGDEYADVVMDCLEDAAAARIPVVVQHPNYMNFSEYDIDFGIARFARIGEHAEALGVKIAVENMEMPELFTAMTDRLDPAVFGVCWDCGHNFAYTPDFDPLALRPGRILTVHLHDNDGKTVEGLPNTRDDAHFLPFDGRLDWQNAMARLTAAGYDGPLMLEVKRGRAPCRNIPAYAEMGQARFLKEAYTRARRLAALSEGKETKV